MTNKGITQVFDSKGFAKELRAYSDLPLRDMADKVGGVSASTLSRVMRGEAPDLETFVRVCKWTGFLPSRFFK